MQLARRYYLFKKCPEDKVQNRYSSLIWNFIPNEDDIRSGQFPQGKIDFGLVILTSIKMCIAKDLFLVYIIHYSQYIS